MKTSLIVSALAATALLAACSSTGKDTDGGVSDGTVQNFEIRETLKSGAQSYRLSFNSGDTAYLTLSATVQWPEDLGGCDLKALQDSLIGILGVKPDISIDRAILAYINNPNMLDGSDEPFYTAVKVDSVPEGIDESLNYEISTTARVIELTERTVTFQVYNYSYVGGVHPNYTYDPFTYDLTTGKVLTYNMLFKSGCEDKLLTAVEESLARQLGVDSAAHLANAGVFPDQMFLSKDVYICDGQIMFHYNPYEIGPYSLGSIDVAVPPFVISNLLSDTGAQLLLDE